MGERLNSRTLTPKWPCFCSTKGEKSVLVQVAEAVKPPTGWLRQCTLLLTVLRARWEGPSTARFLVKASFLVYKYPLIFSEDR